MMKKALSLLLALAMVMSMFTVGAFAETTPSESGGSDPTTPSTSEKTDNKNDPSNWVKPDGTNTNAVSVSPTTKEIVENGTVELEASHTDLASYADMPYDFTGTDAVTYAWSAKKNADTEGGEATDATSAQLTFSSTSAKKVTLTGLAAGTYTVTVKATLKGTWTGETKGTNDFDTKYWANTATATITVIADNNEVRLYTTATSPTQYTGTTKSVTLLPAGTAALPLTAQLWSKASGTGESATEATQITGDVTVKYKSSNTSVATIGEDNKITAGAAGTATITAELTYKGKTYTATVCTVSVTGYGLSDVTVVNGSNKSYTAKDLATQIASNIATVQKSVKSLTTAPTVTITSLALEIPSNSWIKTVSYGGTAQTAASNKWSVTVPAADLSATNKSLVMTTTPGTIDSTGITIKYSGKYSATGTVTATDVEFSGTLTLKSGYAASLTASQYADFTQEQFRLDSAGTNIYYVGPTSNTTFSNYTRVGYTLVTPSTSLSNGQWTQQYTGYEYGGVAHLVTVTFTAKDYDLSLTAKNGDAPFQFSDFESFASSVNSEQNVSSTSRYVSVSSVKLGTPTSTGSYSSSTGLKLKKGSYDLTSYTSLTKSELESVTLAVTTPGTYTIPFTVNYTYRNGTSSSWSTYTSTYSGKLRIYATGDGNIQYDVNYGEKVTFSAADFLSFLRTETKNSSATLNYVVFPDGQPATGALYRTTYAYSTNTLTSAQYFYYSANSSQNSLGAVTYLAASTPRTEYSVSIPFVAYGTSNGVSVSKTGLVEIVVNGALPFTDVRTTDTFYEYIRYCYRNGLMTGTSSTTFGASTSITRQQLALVLYRIAGSPTTYNNKTLAFSDCKGLGAESQAALKWAVNTKIITGYSDGTFHPKSAVTRQAMLTMVYRFAKVKGVDTSVYSSSLNSFKDAAKVSPNMKTAVNWAVENGLVGGNNGYVSPKGNTTRGAAAKILGNFHSYYMA